MLTAQEVADRLGMTLDWTQRRLRNGTLPGRKVDGRWLTAEADLLAHIPARPEMSQELEDEFVNATLRTGGDKGVPYRLTPEPRFPHDNADLERLAGPVTTRRWTPQEQAYAMRLGRA